MPDTARHLIDLGRSDARKALRAAGLVDEGLSDSVGGNIDSHGNNQEGYNQ